MNILMIDDDYLDLEGMKVMLKNCGFEEDRIFACLSCRQAREVLRRREIGIILCDIEMPDESGMDFARWLNAQGRLIPLIFITSHANFEYASEAVRLHVHDYLLKPVSQTTLKSALERADAYSQVIQPEEDVVTPVIEYIRSHLNEKICRNELAEQVYLHPDYLTHIFKEKTGMSISAWILKERIDQAKNLLARTNRSISTVALDCGFSDASYFTKIFRRETGVSPGQYREDV